MSNIEVKISQCLNIEQYTNTEENVQASSYSETIPYRNPKFRETNLKNLTNLNKSERILPQNLKN